MKVLQGIPRSGKISPTVMAEVHLALIARRRVFTNLPLNIPELVAAHGPAAASLIFPLCRDYLIGALDTSDGRYPRPVVKPGDLLIIDPRFVDPDDDDDDDGDFAHA